jgi:hypothetical protein
MASSGVYPAAEQQEKDHEGGRPVNKVVLCWSDEDCRTMAVVWHSVIILRLPREAAGAAEQNPLCYEAGCDADVAKYLNRFVDSSRIHQV